LSAASAAPTLSDRTGITLDAFMTVYYFPHVKVHKRSWKRDEQLYRLRIKEKFGALPRSQISRRCRRQQPIPLKAWAIASSFGLRYPETLMAGLPVPHGLERFTASLSR